MSIRNGALASLFEGAVEFAFGLAVGDGGAFVVFGFASAHADEDFGVVVFEVHSEGDDGDAFGLDLAGEFDDLAFVSEQCAGLCGDMGAGGGGVISDVDRVHVEAWGIIADADIALCEADATIADAFDL